MIDRATIDKIMEATNIVDVVGEFVTLRKAGVNYKGLCPFHDDKTPSFIVSPSKGICHCFACGKGGNAVNFLMEHEQFSYPDALRWLANKYHIEVKEKELSEEELKQQGERESMFIVNEWAKNYFHQLIHDHPDGVAIGKQYFRSRGVRDDIIEKFQLGYALANRTSMSAAALAAGYSDKFLVKTGLCYRRDSGELVDRYAGRVIFPWFNISGRICAFGGRLLDSRTKGVQQKYVNSPESDIYHKDHQLYGLFQAKRSISKEDAVFMVEGYTDVIAMHQCGIENVVANSGTALSVHQIKLLRRFTQNIVLLYDGDEAGIHAAMRGTDMLLAEGMNVKVVLLPDGDDPDSFAKHHSSEELKEYITTHQRDFIDFKTELTLKGVTDPVKRSEAISGIVKSVSEIPNQITRDTYLRQCSQQLGMSEETLINSMNRMIHDKHAQVNRTEQQAPVLTTHATIASGLNTNQENRLEQIARMLVQCVVREGERIIFDQIEAEDGSMVSLNVAQYIQYDLEQDDLQLPQEIYTQILDEAVEKSSEEGFCAEAYFVHHPDVRISKLANQLAILPYRLSKRLEPTDTMENLRQRVTHLILDFRLAITSDRLRQIQQQLKEVGGDMQRIKQLMEEFRDTKLIHDTLAKRLGR